MVRQRHSRGSYPSNWLEISTKTKKEADWKCIRCGADNDRISGHVLTVHHLDLNPSNNAWWNLAALCQRCHLHIQSKVVMERIWLYEHSEWFKPYVAGYYAHLFGYPEDREYVKKHQDVLILIGSGGQSRQEAIE